MALRIHDVRWQVIDHGEEDHIQRLLFVVHVEQIVHVRDAHLGREARIDGPALGPRFVKLLGRVVGVDQVLGRYAQRLEVGAEHRIARVLIQDARNADAQAGAPLHSSSPRFLPRRKRIARERVSDSRRLERFEDHLGRDFGHIRIGVLDRIHALLDLAHGVHVFHQSAIATVVDDQALGALGDGDLGSLEANVFHRHARHQLDVDKRAQALVLAEIAARVFVAMRDVADLLDSFHSDEAGLAPHSP